MLDHTDHHLLVGAGAQTFARNMGFAIEADLNTERSHARWLEWKRRIDPGHYLDPKQRVQAGEAASRGNVAAERARQGGRAALELDRLPEAAQIGQGLTGPAQLLDPERTIPIVLSILVALLISLPVVWVYRWTRPQRRYSQTFAHTLLVVPIAITLVVFLVKGSLALAFSLAGIVAAVRFRTTLDEPMDAVYLFLVIGTGLAAGVQLLVVALLASIMFNAVALAVWRLNVGGQAIALNGWNIVPVQMETRLPGAASPPGPVAPVEEEAPEPYNARLCLHVTHVDEAQRFAIPFLQERTKKWPSGRSDSVKMCVRRV